MSGCRTRGGDGPGGDRPAAAGHVHSVAHWGRIAPSGP
jgi:hypothetical protein